MSELRDRILSAQDLASECLFVEEWGVEVEVRGMSARARAVLLQQALVGDRVDLASAYPLLVIECTFHPETGERLFTRDDIDALSDKAGSALERIAVAAARLSGIDGDAAERSKSDAAKP